MAGWAGFTEEDLRKMRQTSPERGRKNLVNKKTPVQNKKPRMPNRDRLISNTPTIKEVDEDIIPSQRLSQPKPPPTKQKPQPLYKLNGGNVTSTSKKDDQEENKQQEKGTGETRELDESEVINAELSNMEIFQKQQKMIEEANKQKTALLAKTINERRLKAKAESVKLTKIQKELNHLDHLLTADVSVIRDKIEMASLEYLESQKRYDKAEKEVIASKMNLFEKGELKERLTEHLYTIIHQNEIRKSKKLADLMEILEMEISAEEMELQVTPIPMLTNFNSVQTLTSPTRDKQSEVKPESHLEQTASNHEQPASNHEQPASNHEQPASNHEQTDSIELSKGDNSHSIAADVTVSKQAPQSTSGPCEQTISSDAQSGIKIEEVNSEDKSLTNNNDLKTNSTQVTSSNLATTEVSNNTQPCI